MGWRIESGFEMYQKHSDKRWLDAFRPSEKRWKAFLEYHKNSMQASLVRRMQIQEAASLAMGHTASVRMPLLEAR